jgi:alkylation response protein AidB-like acyl-CoA dehydrogenase
MIGTYGKPGLIEAWCGELVTGEKLASYCLTEPNAGSDAGNLRSTARLDGDNYIVNGSKMFISGAGATEVVVGMLRTGGDGPKGISAFAIPADAAGVSYGKKEEKMGWNSQPTRTVTFEDVMVPAANMLGSEGQGFKIAMKGLDGGRINIATCSIGTDHAALEAKLEYVKERKQFGQAIADFQNTQFKLADMTTELVAARQMVRLAAFKLDSGDPEASSYCAMAKRFVTDVCFNICNDALQLHGGYGYIKEYPLERHVRDSRVHQILEGTNEIMRVIIGRRLLIDGALEVIK